jgi:cytochrome oxidase assembly protein ShyY1
MAHVADCLLTGGGKARVVLGWSRDPAPAQWRGGEVMGVIAPGPRLIADPPLAGLAPSARPDPADIPNNHLSYAVQWFLFAATALVIYALALRKRLAGEAPRR